MRPNPGEEMFDVDTARTMLSTRGAHTVSSSCTVMIGQTPRVFLWFREAGSVASRSAAAQSR